MAQLTLPLPPPNLEPVRPAATPVRDRLLTVLAEDLEFHGMRTSYATHNLHSFPAKFPPQLPQKFILSLTEPGDTVLDPMAGSGTTLLEAGLAGRHAIGFDIDPLALLLCRVKLFPLPTDQAASCGMTVVRQAQSSASTERARLAATLDARFDPKTRVFVDYWFPGESQLELMALVEAIEQVEEVAVRDFLRLTLSATIITKSGGVSLARDLAHTRPHKDETLPIRSAITSFDKRLQQNLASVARLPHLNGHAHVEYGDAQYLALPEESVDLIVTSPPYAANAIDYMRAHKFSLVWLGYPLEALSQRRREYIGGEATDGFALESLPERTQAIVDGLSRQDAKKARAVHRYYSEATRFLGTMYRVLRPGKAAVIVVGTSTFKGHNIQIQDCLAEIGETVGFDLVGIATRRLDRNKRMMPTRHGGKQASQIEERMHEEYIIGLCKPTR